MNHDILEFLEEVDKILGETSWRKKSPASLVRQWDGFVSSCEEGYSWDVSEYNDEIGVRTTLERILTAKTLVSYSELIGALAEEVQKIDDRFRCLLQTDVELPDREHWWERGVLKRAGPPYADFHRAAYGIAVELAEG